MRACVLAAAALLAAGCAKHNLKTFLVRDYRQEMRAFVREISSYAKKYSKGFLIVPQNGVSLLTMEGTPEGKPVKRYLKAIDGLGQESLYYGHGGRERATPLDETRRLAGFLDIGQRNGKQILVTDYPGTRAQARESYRKNRAKDYLSFAAEKSLSRIPEYPEEPYGANADGVRTLSDAKNFFYLLDPGRFPDRDVYLDALRGLKHDILIIDLFYEGKQLTRDEVASLKTKPQGGRRIVLAYMSIGEAEDYRWYWRPAYAVSKTTWMDEVNPEWAGNYKVRYWDPGWKRIICGEDDSYLDRIMATGFDGAYLDIIDAFEYFEAKPKPAL